MRYLLLPLVSYRNQNKSALLSTGLWALQLQQFIFALLPVFVALARNLWAIKSNDSCCSGHISVEILRRWWKGWDFATAFRYQCASPRFWFLYFTTVVWHNLNIPVLDGAALRPLTTVGIPYAKESYRSYLLVLILSLHQWSRERDRSRIPACCLG